MNHASLLTERLVEWILNSTPRYLSLYTYICIHCLNSFFHAPLCFSYSFPCLLNSTPTDKKRNRENPHPSSRSMWRALLINGKPIGLNGPCIAGAEGLGDEHPKVTPVDSLKPRGWSKKQANQGQFLSWTCCSLHIPAHPKQAHSRIRALTSHTHPESYTRTFAVTHTYTYTYTYTEHIPFFSLPFWALSSGPASTLPWRTWDLNEGATGR